MTEQPTKRCTKCDEVKPLTEFYRDKSKRDGLKPGCKECMQAAQRQYLAANGEKRRAGKRQYRAVNPDKVREGDRRHRTRIQNAVLNHYGRSCVCCGTTDNLSIDHVSGDGKEHRLSLFGRNAAVKWSTYRWLIANGFPGGFQTLCRPCNRSKGTRAACRLIHVSAERELSDVPA